MIEKYCSCGCGRKVNKNRKWLSGHNANKNSDRHDWSDLEKHYKELKSTVKVAEIYGCSHEAVSHQMKKKGIKVNDQRIDTSSVRKLYKNYQSVTKVAEILGCSVAVVKDFMRREGHNFTHDNKSLEICVGMGRYGERIALSMFEGSLDMNEWSIHSPYDIEWKGMKIDVKISRARIRPNGKTQYSFNANNKKCSHYLLISVDENDEPKIFFMIPKNEVLGVTISYTEGKETKWDKFKMEVNEDELKKVIQNAKRIG